MHDSRVGENTIFKTTYVNTCYTREIPKRGKSRFTRSFFVCCLCLYDLCFYCKCKRLPRLGENSYKTDNKQKSVEKENQTKYKISSPRPDRT